MTQVCSWYLLCLIFIVATPSSIYSLKISQKNHQPFHSVEKYILRKQHQTTQAITSGSERRDILKVMLKTSVAFVVGYNNPAITVSCGVSQALSPEEASRKYDNYAKTYNQLDGGVAAKTMGLDSARERLIQKAKGDVLGKDSNTVC